MTTELLVSFAPAGCGLQLEDVLIDNMSINYALKEKNPVDGVHFFTSDRPDRKFKIPKEQVSNLIPDQFLERYIRIYLRDPDDVEKFDGAKAAVRQYLRVHTNGALTASPYSSTARPVSDAFSSSSSSSSSSGDANAMSGVTQARVLRLGRNFSGIIADSAASSPADARKKIVRFLPLTC